MIIIFEIVNYYNNREGLTTIKMNKLHNHKYGIHSFYPYT